MEVPKTILENLQYRAKLINQANKDEKFKQVISRKCELDNVFFCNSFCWTYDPREKFPHLPFILYPRQEELFRYLDELLQRAEKGEKINLIIDKPRAVGATYTLMMWILHKFLFTQFSARVGSRKEDYVDKRGEPDTLFYKIDYNLERLPNWIKGDITRSSMLAISKNGSISGESANPNFGRGGRKSVTEFDELGFWDWARSSWESSGEATNFRIAMSTPPESGNDSYFSQLLRGMKGKVHKFEFGWRDVPTRDDDWLRMQKENKSEEEFAREVLKSYEGTTTGKVYAKDCRLMRYSDIDYNGQLPLYISWDFGLDSTAMIWWQKDFSTNKLRIIDAYENTIKEIGFFVPFVTGTIKSLDYQYDDRELEIIDRHREWRQDITHYGDPSVEQRHHQSGLSTKDILMRNYYIYIQSTPWGGRKWKDLRDKTRQVFRRIEINDKRCEYLITCLRQAKYPKLRENSQNTNEIAKPVHDWTSHFRTAFEYFVDNEPEGYIAGKYENVNNIDDFNNLFK